MGREKLAIYGSLLLAAIGSIALGLTIQNELLSAIAGAVLGVALGGLLNVIEVERFFGKISRMFEPELASDPEEIKYYRQKWHLYHVTELRGKFVWRYRIFDYSSVMSATSLTSRSEEPYPTNLKALLTEAGVRRDRLFIVGYPDDRSEKAMVYVFPFPHTAYSGDDDVDSGLVLVETFSKETHSFSPAILSNQQLIGRIKPGTVREEHWEKLDTIWARHLGSRLRLLPRVVASVLEAANTISPDSGHEKLPPDDIEKCPLQIEGK
jgi:hypothetical protein